MYVLIVNPMHSCDVQLCLQYSGMLLVDMLSIAIGSLVIPDIHGRCYDSVYMLVCTA